MLGNLFGGIFGKYIVGGIAILGVAAALYIAMLTVQIKEKENVIIRQEHTILVQDGEIQGLELIRALQIKANDLLNLRLLEGEKEQRDLVEQLEFIFSRGEEYDGPVAPVLEDVVRKLKDSHEQTH